MQKLSSGLVVVTPDDVVPVREPIRLRWVVYSKEKRGKTTLAMSNPRAFVIDNEKKADLVEGRKAAYSQPSNLKDHDSIIDWLCAAKRPYDMVVEDTIDELLHGLVIPGMTEEVKASLKAQNRPSDFPDIREFQASAHGSRGWDMVNGRVLGYLRRLTQAGYSWMVLGHVKEKLVTIRQPNGQFVDITVARPAIPDGIRMGLARMGEVFAETAWEDSTESSIEVLDGKVWTLKTPDHDRRVAAGEKLLTRPHTEKTRSMMLRIKEQSDGSEVAVGSNVRTLPPRVALSLGDGWGDVERASESLRALRAKTNG